jgi:CrcB protein
MQKILFIGLAGLVGTLVRYWLSMWADGRWGPVFPAGTLVVNLLGCLAVGFLLHATETRYSLDPALRSALFLGLLGGFTTFSSYGVQTFNLVRTGHFFLAALNVVVSNAAGLLLVWVGYTASTRVFHV